jgi:hypothetical protein
VMAAGVWAASRGIVGYRYELGALAVLLMAVNALGAVAPLHWTRQANPLRTYFLSMLIRLAAIGAFTIALVMPKDFKMGDALSFVLSAMAAFVVFTSLEVRHFIRHQPTLLSR